MRSIVALICSAAMAVFASMAPVSSLAETPPEEIGLTPPRLGFVNGRVLFFRPGDPGWVDALVNTPLAAGDRLETDASGSLELQIGARSFLRAWGNSAVELVGLEADAIRFGVGEGRVTFDLQDRAPGRTVEAVGPNLLVSFDRPGSYRVDVDGSQTRLIVRNGGRALVMPEGGSPFGVADGRAAIVTAGPSPQVSSLPAPPPDSWDEWNAVRSDYLQASDSARYVPEDVYGSADLDRHGRWQVEPGYGPVWTPGVVPAGWAPYSTGVWVHDPYYGWTWVDSAPWGWAPYHYGRWVHVGGQWAWAPGPMVRPIYAPALVAFLDVPRVQIGFSVGAPLVSWVALGWGEPCVPWWGRPGFIHRPWWGGWGGPRVVNNVVVRHTTVVNAREINVYRNTRVQQAVSAAPKERFGRTGFSPSRYQRVNETNLRPMHAAPEPLRKTAVSGRTAERLKRPSQISVRQPLRAGSPERALPNADRQRRDSNDRSAVRPPQEPGRRMDVPPSAREARELPNPRVDINRPEERRTNGPRPQTAPPARRHAAERLQPPADPAPKSPAGSNAPGFAGQPRRPDRVGPGSPAPAPHIERPERAQPPQTQLRVAPGQRVQSPRENRGNPAMLKRSPATEIPPHSKRVESRAPLPRRPAL
ncbi:MAG: DUF6600 domain-containing protein [Desulfobacterales bacterium]